MFEKISTPILLAIIIYQSYHYYMHWKLVQSVSSYQQEKFKEKVKTTYKEKLPKIMKVTEEIYVAVDYALANSIMLIGDSGIVIVDTTESPAAAERIYKDFRKITDKPIKGIVYTHNHADHVLGTKSFLQNETDVEIWAHHTLTDIFFHSTSRVGAAHYLRSMYQIGGLLGDRVLSAGIGRRLQIDDLGAALIPPNRFLYKNQQSINIAGLDLELIHIPGETDDQIAVYLPKQKALLCADDFYLAFPNLYAIRGTPFRSLKLWTESLDKMRNIRAEYLIPSHTEPIVGDQTIYSQLTDYRDAIQHVHDQTVRFINKGLHPDEIASQIKLPKNLEDNEYLKEVYGTIRWSSKNLFAGYMGWFSGDISELNQHTPTEQAKRLVKLAGGINKVIVEADKSLKENDAQWALQLTSSVLRIEQNHQVAKEIKAMSLLELASQQTSMNGRNYYLTCAYELIGEIEVKLDETLKKKKVKNAKINDLFYLLSLKVKAEQCPELDKVVLFKFPDTQEKVIFHMRNGIFDFSGTYTRKEDIKVTVDSVVWREILSGDRSGLLSALTSKIIVEPGIAALQEIMNCIDKD